jgi:hypothetical protein
VLCIVRLQSCGATNSRRYPGELGRAAKDLFRPDQICWDAKQMCFTAAAAKCLIWMEITSLAGHLFYYRKHLFWIKRMFFVVEQI